MRTAPEGLLYLSRRSQLALIDSTASYRRGYGGHSASSPCQGAAERAWGEILSGRPRDSYILAAKVFFPMSEDPADQGLSAAQIHKQIDASLARLRTDPVDLYQAHRFDPDVPIEETLEALGEVVAAGKARSLGFSEWTVEQIHAAVENRRRRVPRLQPATALDALAGARDGTVRCRHATGHLAHRLVTARPRRPDRQVPPR